MIQNRTSHLLTEQQQNIFVRTDRLFAGLMLFQWFAAIFIALVISPKTWSGQSSQIHLHVWIAVFLGGAITSFPVILALWRSGRASTRHIIAIGQMLMSALLIHLTGGRIETHFHVFGSLAFLAFYRDWKVLISASVVVALDHFLRGLYWPQSVYGILATDPWRWLEHTGWVVFEDIFLIVAGQQSLRDMRMVAQRQAELEITQDQIENTVKQRTTELKTQSEVLLQTSEQMAQQTRELIRSNTDLEQFAYVTSHDLREPLRNVTSFAQLLAQRYKTKLDAEADEFIGFITDGVARMNVLIDDLLTYSHVGKISAQTSMNSATVFAEVLADMRTTLKETSTVVTYDALPTLDGDAREWRQLFQNLLGNAVKFHGTEAPRIHVSAERKHDPKLKGELAWIFSIKDNGIGIEDAFSDRIFIIFQRLHNRSEYPGTGIGLAICKKIVERHEGRIWVESQPGKGSIFRFSIPCKS